jgi:hypothetical protein
MSATYKSLTTDKKLVFSSRFKDGKIRVYLENIEFYPEPLYIIPAISSKSIFRLSAFDIEIYNYPKRDMFIVNKWPREVFSKIQ